MADSAVRRMKRRLAAVVAGALKRPPLNPSDLVALKPKDILIIRQHNQMGDMVCATPALRAIGETWPEARLHLVTSPVNGAVVAHHPAFTRVLTFSQKMWRRPWALAAFARSLRRPRCELALILGSVSFSVTSAVIALASGAHRIVGPDSRPYGWDISRHLFAVELPATPVIDRHAVQHNLAPLQAVGITTDDLTTEVVPADEERAAAAALMAELGLAPGFWALHPGAGKGQNIWPAEGFAEMARRAADMGHQVLILHGPADRASLRALESALEPDRPVAVLTVPPQPVGVCAALLEQADRYLGNDTGMMHVAGALGVPTVALFGPTDPALWKPPGELVVALRSTRQTPDGRGEEFGWMENIAPEAVWKAWSGLPGRAGAGTGYGNAQGS